MKNSSLTYRLAIVAAILAIVAPFAFAQATSWNIDPAHSNTEFSIRHLGISNVHGHFGKVSGAINLNSADITKSSVNATIDVAGLETGQEPRDNHLKTPDFFDTAKFATATFISTSVVKSATGLTVTGNLTLHGITKPVTLNVETSAPITSPMDHKQHAGFSATTTIARKDFDIGSKFPEAILSDAVKLEIEIEAVQQ
jgi:polyisoprenoid-binding protein YceI